MTDTQKLIVHHMSDAGSMKILWLLEELGTPYEIKYWERTSRGQAPEELKKIHPLGKSPIIQDGDFTLAETAAIVDYILHKYGGGRFRPTESQYLDNLYYTRYVDGSLMPLYIHWLLFTIIPAQSPFFVRPLVRPLMNTILNIVVRPRMKDNFEMLDKHLGERPGKFVAGGDDPTDADFLLIFPFDCFYAIPHESGIKEYKGIATYVDMVHNRPAYKRALEKGGSYDLDFSKFASSK